MGMDNKKRLGVLRGGTGKNYEASLIKGGDVILHVFDNLSDKYKIIDVLIDKEGLWHINGLPIKPAEIAHRVDLVWNLADAGAMALLQHLAIPHVGNSSFTYALENSREMLREHVRKLGVGMPRRIVLPVYQQDFDGPIETYAPKKAREIFEKFSAPWVVHSFTPDLRTGMYVANTLGELATAIDECVKNDMSIVVEEFIPGTAGAAHSVAGFRGEEEYVVSPGNFSPQEKEEIMALVRDLHRHLGARHYLKSDFILHPKRGIYLTGVEFTPNLRKNSHFEQACESVGAKAHHVVEHILEDALR